MLMRFDPFRELDRLTQEMWQNTGGAVRWSAMPMDAYRKGDTFYVHFDLPGVDPEAIDLTVDKGVLTVTAERRWEAGDDVEIVINERPQGRFTRQLFLGDGLDHDRISASYDAGVLTLTIPVADAAKPRKVQVTTSSGAAVGSGQASS